MTCAASAAHFFKNMPFPRIIKERQHQKRIKQIGQEEAPTAGSRASGAHYPIGQHGKKDWKHQHA